MSITGFNRRRRDIAKIPEPAPPVATTPAPTRRKKARPFKADTEQE